MPGPARASSSAAVRVGSSSPGRNPPAQGPVGSGGDGARQLGSPAGAGHDPFENCRLDRHDAAMLHPVWPSRIAAWPTPRLVPILVSRMRFCHRLEQVGRGIRSVSRGADHPGSLPAESIGVRPDRGRLRSVNSRDSACSVPQAAICGSHGACGPVAASLQPSMGAWRGAAEADPTRSTCRDGEGT